MEHSFINLSPENIGSEHLCCIIRSRKPHPGVEAKRKWLAEQLKHGHVFRKLDAKGCCFIEYAPLESAWVPVVGENYLYIYCLWTEGEFRSKGYGRALMEYCIADAKEKGRSGICMLGAKKQKNWLSSQAFAKKYGFITADTTDSGYELLALSFDGTLPRFADSAKLCRIEQRELTIYYDMQCPYIYQKIEDIRGYCEENKIPVSLNCVDSPEKAKSLPCVFNNWAVFFNGTFETVNLLDISAVKRLTDRA